MTVMAVFMNLVGREFGYQVVVGAACGSGGQARELKPPGEGPGLGRRDLRLEPR